MVCGRKQKYYAGNQQFGTKTNLLYKHPDIQGRKREGSLFWLVESKKGQDKVNVSLYKIHSKAIII